MTDRSRRELQADFHHRRIIENALILVSSSRLPSAPGGAVGPMEHIASSTSPRPGSGLQEDGIPLRP